MGLNSCVSSKPVEVRTVYVIPALDFPDFPDPKLVIPLDDNGVRVTDNDTPITNVIMPLWYWNLIIDYKLGVDDAETYYNAYRKKLNN